MEINPFDTYTAEYEIWFKENEIIFQSELLALKQVVPIDRKGIEIGIGSGIFAEKLNIEFGIDPSEKMLEYAKQRNLIVEQGIAEKLPYSDKNFEFAVLITSICFIKNPQEALKEANRILVDNGIIVIAFIDKDSFIGKTLEKQKSESKFYKNANFYSVKEMISLIELCNFEIVDIVQTLIDTNLTIPENPKKGYGEGSFVVIKGIKR
jgi:ubiquinone/menaquinone biosynthesis C-methylase UbiE